LFLIFCLNLTKAPFFAALSFCILLILFSLLSSLSSLFSKKHKKVSSTLQLP
jgi:hypothetical protein